MKATRAATCPEDIAAHRLALHALTQPEQRRSLAIGDRRFFDQGFGHAAELGRARRRHGRYRGRELFRTDCMIGEEGLIDEVPCAQHMQHAESEGSIAAGPELEMNVGGGRRVMGDGIDHDDPGAGSLRFLQPVFVLMRRRM